MDQVSTIAETFEKALNVPGLLTLIICTLVFACVAVASAVATLVWWARGVVTWKDYTAEREAMAEQMAEDRAMVTKAIATLRGDVDDRMKRAEEVITNNSHTAIMESRRSEQKMENHVSRFEQVVDKVVEVVGQLKTQVAMLMAISGMKGP